MPNPAIPLGPELTDKVALGAANPDAAGGVLLWQNHETDTVLVTRLVIEVTTPSTGASTSDFGTAGASNATSNDMIAGLNTHAAGITIAKATKTYVRRDPGQWITGSTSTGSTVGLAGFAYITYLIIP
jgi:hypothetical protein